MEHSILVVGNFRGFGADVVRTLKKTGAEAVYCNFTETAIGEQLILKPYSAMILPCFRESEQLFRLIRGIMDRCPNIVIFMTMYYDSPELRDKLVELGVCYFFKMPYLAQNLGKKIADLLEHGGDDLHSRIVRFLNEYGFPKKLKGYDYMITAMELCVTDPSRLHRQLMGVYREVGEINGVKDSNVERNLRTLTEKMIKTGEMIKLTGGRRVTEMECGEMLISACNAFAEYKR